MEGWLEVKGLAGGGGLSGGGAGASKICSKENSVKLVLTWMVQLCSVVLGWWGLVLLRCKKYTLYVKRYTH